LENEKMRKEMRNTREVGKWMQGTTQPILAYKFTNETNSVAFKI
jgi:hypothetical protein